MHVYPQLRATFVYGHAQRSFTASPEDLAYPTSSIPLKIACVHFATLKACKHRCRIIMEVTFARCKYTTRVWPNVNYCGVCFFVTAFTHFFASFLWNGCFIARLAYIKTHASWIWIVIRSIVISRLTTYLLVMATFF